MDDKNQLQTVQDAIPVIHSESGQLLRMAIEKDLDVDKLKALMDLRDRDDLRKAEREFEEHFAEMQKDYIPAYKSKEVKTGGDKVAYSYCPLPLILQVYAPILAKHGFSYRWEEHEVEGKNEKRTTCFLSGYGFTRQASISLPYGQTNQLINPIQARGATSEYGRRYTFMNVTGCIVADDTDTDGRTDSPQDTKGQTQPKPKQTQGQNKPAEQPKSPEQNPAPQKLSSSTLRDISEMADEMIRSNYNGWTVRRKELTLQKAKVAGEKVALDGMQKEYEKFCSFMAAKVNGSKKPPENNTPDSLDHAEDGGIF